MEKQVLETRELLSDRCLELFDEASNACLKLGECFRELADILPERKSFALTADVFFNASYELKNDPQKQI